MNRMIRRRAARQDLVDIVYHYIRTDSPATARRFRNEVEATIQLLAGMPGLGVRYEHEHPALAELRYFPISRFKNYLVFHRPVVGAIEIVRVLHGARDIHRMTAEAFGIDEDGGDDEVDEEAE